MASSSSALSAPLRELVTLVVVPKDWYSHAIEGLWAVLDSNPGVRVLYCLSPPHPAALDAALTAACARHPTTLELLRSPPLTDPYAMRQSAAERVRTPYYVVLGNDTWGEDMYGENGWLARLVATAEAQPSAAVVQPLILERSVTHNDTLHVWWHPLQLIITSNNNSNSEALLSTSFDRRMVTLSRPNLQRQLTPGHILGFVEDHALLIRVSAFPPTNPPLWDPAASARREFFDLAWTVAAAGHAAILEPRAVVTYRKVRPLSVSDLSLFIARRHDEACVRALVYLESKWRVRTRIDRWHESHRDEALTGTRFWAGKWVIQVWGPGAIQEGGDEALTGTRFWAGKGSRMPEGGAEQGMPEIGSIIPEGGAGMSEGEGRIPKGEGKIQEGAADRLGGMPERKGQITEGKRQTSEGREQIPEGAAERLRLVISLLALVGANRFRIQVGAPVAAVRGGEVGPGVGGGADRFKMQVGRPMPKSGVRTAAAWAGAALTGEAAAGASGGWACDARASGARAGNERGREAPAAPVELTVVDALRSVGGTMPKSGARTAASWVSVAPAAAGTCCVGAFNELCVVDALRSVDTVCGESGARSGRRVLMIEVRQDRSAIQGRASEAAMPKGGAAAAVISEGDSLQAAAGAIPEGGADCPPSRLGPKVISVSTVTAAEADIERQRLNELSIDPFVCDGALAEAIPDGTYCPLSRLPPEVISVTTATTAEPDLDRQRLTDLSVDPFVSYLLLRVQGVRPGPLRNALLPLASAAFAMGQAAPPPLSSAALNVGEGAFPPMGEGAFAVGQGAFALEEGPSAVGEGAVELWLWLRESAGVGGAIRRRLAALCAAHGAVLAGEWDEYALASLQLPWPPPLVLWAYRPLRVDEPLQAMAALGGGLLPPRYCLWPRTFAKEGLPPPRYSWWARALAKEKPLDELQRMAALGGGLPSRAKKMAALSGGLAQPPARAMASLGGEFSPQRYFWLARSLAKENPRATLTLCNTCGSRLSLHFIVRNTPVAKRWLSQLRTVNKRRLGVKYKNRLYGFPHDTRTPPTVSKEIREAACVLNSYRKGVVPEHLLLGAGRTHVAKPLDSPTSECLGEEIWEAAGVLTSHKKGLVPGHMLGREKLHVLGRDGIHVAKPMDCPASDTGVVPQESLGWERVHVATPFDNQSSSASPLLNESGVAAGSRGSGEMQAEDGQAGNGDSGYGQAELNLLHKGSSFLPQGGKAAAGYGLGEFRRAENVSSVNGGSLYGQAELNLLSKESLPQGDAAAGCEHTGCEQAGYLDSAYNQAELNLLHKVFEDLRGSIESPAPFFHSAPPHVRAALEDLNLHIHRLEDLHRQAERRARGQPVTPRLTVAFDHARPRVPLRDEDLQHFTVRMGFGTLYLNYCVVGKHLLELFQDGDDACGNDNVRPQRMMSADVQGYFGPSMSDEEASLRLSEFFDWMRADRERRERWAGKELCLGRIPVADLDRSGVAVRGLSEEEVVDLIGRHQHICSLTAPRRWW